MFDYAVAAVRLCRESLVVHTSATYIPVSDLYCFSFAHDVVHYRFRIVIAVNDYLKDTITKCIGVNERIAVDSGFP